MALDLSQGHPWAAKQGKEHAMKRNLKVPGLAMMVAVALSAVVASGASAHFTFGAGSATLTATVLNNQIFRTTGTPGENSEASCTAIGVGSATFGTEEAELTAHPEYGGTCTITIESIFAGVAAQVITKGCNYIFTTTATDNFHIECEEGKQIEITAFILGKFRPCLDIHAQTPTTALVDYHNGTNAATTKMDIEVEWTVTGITYEKTGSCAKGVIEGNDAKYTGNFTVTAHNSLGEAIDITKS
jgi:hypothetical protein